ncbi:MAG TPA: hypothetical protein DCQ90_06575 [Erysipelotrichaceae bacterium]|nr:hypothetical protein [Erysipelotrichaceae bacterium]
MKITKGTMLKVCDNRSGKFIAVASQDFDSEKDEWYPLVVETEIVFGESKDWYKGEKIPSRRGMCEVTPVIEPEEELLKWSR